MQGQGASAPFSRLEMKGDTMKKACIFDLDGTLLDTLSTIGGYMNEALAPEGVAPFPLDDYRYFVGDGARTLVKRALTAADAYTEERFERVFALYNRLYDAAPNGRTKPYEGVVLFSPP